MLGGSYLIIFLFFRNMGGLILSDIYVPGILPHNRLSGKTTGGSALC